MQLSFGKYAFLSVLAAGGTLWHAFATRREYFPAMYYLATSKLSIAVLGNCFFAVAMMVYFTLVKIFLGHLREAEVERLTERLQASLLELCLTLTVFREDFDAAFVGLLLMLAIAKALHWLLADRVDYMATEPRVALLQHARIISLILVLMAVDVAAARESLSAASGGSGGRGGGYHILFTFEYTILATSAVAAAARYALGAIDAACGHHWQGKGLATLYLDLFVDAVQCVFYLAFFLVTMRRYIWVPVHLIREVYVSVSSLLRRGANYLRYRAVAARLHQLPNATAEDAERAGGACIICREEMVPSAGLKRLRCGHVFHLACLRSWLERQQTCPICRAAILPRASPAASTVAQRAPRAEPQRPADPAAGAEGHPTPGQQQRAGAAAGPGGHGEGGDLHGAAPQQPPRAQQPVPVVGQSGGGRQARVRWEREPQGARRPPGGLEITFESLDQLLASLTFLPTGPEESGQGSGLPQPSLLQQQNLLPAGPHVSAGLPVNATPEQRAAYAAAAAATAAMAPILMPLYFPYMGGPRFVGHRSSTSAPVAPSGASMGAEEVLSKASMSGAPGTDSSGRDVARHRAEAAATSAVRASIAATRQLLEGQASTVQHQLDQLTRFEASALHQPASDASHENVAECVDPGSV